jgi:DNA invertase Pin-like site-specific DNA recombinase
MSRIKIKGPKTKKIKGPIISLKHVMKMKLDDNRREKKTEDDKIVKDMIENELLDKDLLTDYSYIRKVANGLKWTKDRLQKTIDRYTAKLSKVQVETKKLDSGLTDKQE